MKVVRKALLAAAAGWAVLSGGSAMAQASCDRATLQDIADRYVKAQADGSMFALPVGEWVDYRENLVMSSSATGVLGTAREFAWTSKLLDTAQCRVYVEGVITAPEPYVLATVVNNGFFGVNQISTMVGSGDANAVMAAAKAEDWAEIPAASRAARKDLIAAADAVLDAEATPTVGRDYIVDEARGAVGVFARVGSAEGRATAHVFRIEDGAVKHHRENPARE
ncbi:hypothetical protein [Tsuneonella sp. HG222]